MSTVEYLIILVLLAAVAMGTWKTFGSSGEEDTILQPSTPAGPHGSGAELTTR